jgi:transposase
MGRQVPQSKLFYQVSLEERVPQDHLLRKIASVVDFRFLYDYVRPYYSHTGASSVDPVVIFKMALLGYLYGITSERKLAEECRLNLAFVWFLGYDLDEIPPDHSILSKARARFGEEVYEQFFREVVRMCREAGLVEGDKVFLDATLLKANASLDSLVAREACHRLKETPKEYLDRVWEENPLEGPDDPDRGGSSGKNEGPREESPDKKAAGKSLRTNEKWVSRTDPDASLVTRKGLAKPLLSHKVHIAVDGGRARIVTAVETTPGGVAECHVLPHLIGKHIFSTCSRPKEAVADRAYGTKEVYRFLKGMGILPTVPRRQTWESPGEEA